MSPVDGADARIGSGLAGLPEHTDLLVVGLGVTGAGVALDAASRGLDVVAVDAHDLAFGTSRWSSKLVHGGLRYLARGQLGVAHESAVERGILMDVTAPHLTHPLPMLLPLMSSVGHAQAGLARAGFAAGDLLRRSAGTRVGTLPHPRRITRTEVLAMAPGLRSAGLRGGLLSWDGQLEDDARLVTCIARTAVAHGARVAHPRPGARGHRDHRHPARRADRRDPHDHRPGRRQRHRRVGRRPRRRPACALSRGTHLVLRAATIPGLTTAVTVPVPGSTNRFVFLLPQPDGTIYVGLTDEPVEGPVPDVPEPTQAEIGFLLDVVAAAFDRPLRRSDVVGAYAGLRPLLDHDGTTADLSRRHAVAHLGHRRGDDRRRQAHDVPADGRGRRGRHRARGRALPDPRAAAARRAPPRGARPGRGAAAPGASLRHGGAVRARERAHGHGAERRGAAWRRWPRTCRRPWPSWSSA